MVETKYAPIIVFGFVRVDTLKSVIDSLLKNSISKESDLFLFLDGPRNESEKHLTDCVFDYCRSVQGFKTIEISKSETNIGLDDSIIRGVSQIINRYGRVIVLEDDIVVTSNFLSFMNTALDKYVNSNRIMSICGWGVEIEVPKDYKYDAYLFGRSSSWGWATWKNRWDNIDWEVEDWNYFKNNYRLIKQFNRRGGDDMFRLLKNCMNGGDMWDIRFCFSMFKQNKYSIIPILSKSNNIGYTDLGTHCKPEKFKRFTVKLDTTAKDSFNLPDLFDLDDRIIKQRLKISSNYNRIITKIKNTFLS